MQLTLSKSEYLKESKKLDSYERYLPSLDLKRKQLIIEKNKADIRLSEIDSQLSKLLASISHDVQMLSNTELDLDNLIFIKSVQVGQENLLGVVLPKLESIDFDLPEYGYLTKPHWIDILIKRLRVTVELSVEHNVQKKRVAILSKAVRKATQRVNLVSQILIPEAQKNMRKIKIFLSDNERVAVVRSKIAKRKKSVAGDLLYANINLQSDTELDESL